MSIPIKFLPNCKSLRQLKAIITIAGVVIGVREYLSKAMDEVKTGLYSSLSPMDEPGGPLNFRRVLRRTVSDIKQEPASLEEYVESTLKIAYVNIPALLVLGLRDVGNYVADRVTE